MPLDPPSQALKDQIDAAQAPPARELPVEVTREGYRAMQPPAPEIPVGQIEERELAVDGGTIMLRIYRPEGTGPFPVHLHFHGGGCTIGDLDTHDYDCRELCRQGELLVVAVDYRLAPEHRFPTAVEDCYAATAWAAAHQQEIGGRGGPVSVGGDSAGGYLATTVSMLARDRGGPDICFQLMFYPMLDAAMDTPSYEDVGEGYLLTRATMEWFWDCYCPSEQRDDPLASPLRAPKVAGLPPALIVTAEYDPLRDEGAAYARRLKDAGIDVEYRCAEGVMHSFVSYGRLIPAGAQTLVDSARRLRRAHG